MALLLDHVFIITEPGAAIGDRLVDQGLAEGSANTHPGQGTANRRFFFEGFVLELLFVHDAEEAATGAGRELNLLQRSCDDKASPFGLVAQVADESAVPTFDSWQYYADYFNGELCFFVGSNSTIWSEPLCICMPPALPRRVDLSGECVNADWQLTALEITVPVSQPSVVLEQFAQMDNVAVNVGGQHHLDLLFNNGAGTETVSLAPALPLSLRW